MMGKPRTFDCTSVVQHGFSVFDFAQARAARPRRQGFTRLHNAARAW
jgi:hypothetical protein